VNRSRLIAASVILVSIGFTGPVSAQVQRSGGSPNAQLMQQFQQAVTERTQLQAENSKLKKDVDDLKKQLGTAQQQVTASKAGVARGQAAAIAAAREATDRTQKSLDETKVKMQELVSRYRETITTMRGIESERSQLQQKVAADQSAFDQCAETNYALYQVNAEVLDRYAHQGAFSYLERSEPFTRLKRTQIDNLVLEYKQRAEELRIKKAEAAARSAAAAPFIATKTVAAPTASGSAATAPAATAAPAATTTPAPSTMPVPKNP
jgi:chromosome segregation ATPase